MRRWVKEKIGSERKGCLIWGDNMYNRGGVSPLIGRLLLRRVWRNRACLGRESG
jgi:hypothetical protein